MLSLQSRFSLGAHQTYPLHLLLLLGLVVSVFAAGEENNPPIESPINPEIAEQQYWWRWEANDITKYPDLDKLRPMIDEAYKQYTKDLDLCTTNKTMDNDKWWIDNINDVSTNGLVYYASKIILCKDGVSIRLANISPTRDIRVYCTGAIDIAKETLNRVKDDIERTKNEDIKTIETRGYKPQLQLGDAEDAFANSLFLEWTRSWWTHDMEWFVMTGRETKGCPPVGQGQGVFKSKKDW